MPQVPSRSCVTELNKTEHLYAFKEHSLTGKDTKTIKRQKYSKIICS